MIEVYEYLEAFRSVPSVMNGKTSKRNISILMDVSMMSQRVVIARRLRDIHFWQS